MVRKQLRALILATALPLIFAACSGRVLSPLDQLAIYSAALRAASDSLLTAGSGARLLLDPRLLPPRFTGNTAGQAGAGELDSAIVRRLPVSAVCIPVGALRRCAPGQRGLAAQVSPITRDDRALASVWVQVAPVQGADDNTALVGAPVLFHYVLQQLDTQWRIIRAARGLPG